MARRQTGETAPGGNSEPATPQVHEYEIRRRVELRNDTGQIEAFAWRECGTVEARSGPAALAAYGEANAEAIAALEGDVILEAVSARFRTERTATPRRQLEIKWST